MALRIKNWLRYQHFKDRRPPWIKLYRDLLDDPDWHALDGEVSKLLVALWLIASEDDDQEGKLPDSRRLAFRLRMTEEKINQLLLGLNHWLEQDDINLISERYQPDINLISERYQLDTPETETETETETKIERSQTQNPVVLSKRKEAEIPKAVSQEVWNDFVKLRRAKKSPPTDTAIAAIAREAKKAGWSLEKALQECCARGWTGFKADWVQNEGPKTRETERWQESVNGVRAKGEELGVPWQPGVTFGQYVELLEKSLR
jgi:hypothetical protein